MTASFSRNSLHSGAHFSLLDGLIQAMDHTRPLGPVVLNVNRYLTPHSCCKSSNSESDALCHGLAK